MLIQYLLLALVYTLNILFFWLPQVTTLPTIGGFNIDAALVLGMGEFKTFAAAVWPIQDVWYGFLFLLSWYVLKMLLKFFLGHRAPGAH